jgi:hypothetical protein
VEEFNVLSGTRLDNAAKLFSEVWSVQIQERKSTTELYFQG